MHESIVQLTDFWYRYPEQPDWTLKNLSLSIPRGTLCVITGPTGCGKSTLLHLLAGLLHYSEADIRGDIRIEGKQYDTSQLESEQLELGLLLQDPTRQLHQLTVFDEIISGPAYHGYPWSECEARAYHTANKFLDPNLFESSPWDISLGQQQLVALAALLAVERSVILLDEPSSNLDGVAIRRLRDVLIKLVAEGNTIIMSSHDLTWLGHVPNQVVLMANGTKIAEGTPEKIAYSDILSDTVGRPLSISTALAMDIRENESVSPIDWEEFPENVSLTPVDEIPSIATMHKEKILTLRNVSAGWAKNDLVLNNIDLCCNRGEALAIIGRNGCGKSTLAKTLVRAIPVIKGKIEIAGKESKKYSNRALARFLAFLSQNPSDMIFETTCLREVMFGPKALGLDDPGNRAKAALKKVGLIDYINIHPRTLSVGQQRLLTIAATIVNSPKLLILDEPEYGLDRQTWNKIETILRGEMLNGMGLILITHSLEIAFGLCSRFIVLDDGEILWKEKTIKQATGEMKDYLSPLTTAPNTLDLLITSAQLKGLSSCDKDFQELIRRHLCYTPN